MTTSLKSETSHNAPPVEILSHCLTYANRGWHIFPVKSDKTPYTPHGFKDATTDEKQIREWWERWPHAGIGLATGERSGVWVLDVDGEEGQRSIANFEIEVDDNLPRTLAARSPSKASTHFYFLYTERVGSRAGIVPGVDIRGDAGYIILPPSECVNKQGEQRPYAWLNNDDPLNPEESNFVMALLESLSDSKKDKDPTPVARTNREPNHAWGDSVLLGETERVAQAPEGLRNQTLNLSSWKVGKAVGGGHLDEDDATHALLDAARLCGLAEDDGEKACLKTIRSGIEAGKREPAHPKEKSPAGNSIPEEIGEGRYDVMAKAYLEDTGFRYARWDGEWWHEQGASFQRLTKEGMTRDLHIWARTQTVETKDGPKPFAPTTAKLRELDQAVRAQVPLLPDGVLPPLVGGVQSDVIPLVDGIFDPKTGETGPRPSDMFTTWSLPVTRRQIDERYRSETWEDFVGSVFEGDPDAYSLMQQWFGYCLIPGNPYEKMLVVEGVKRGGKGTLQTALQCLMGGRVAFPTLNTMAGRFGLQSLMTAPLAIIPDARSNLDPEKQAVAVERLLSIAGGDEVMIDRKFKEEAPLKLRCKIAIFTNQLPNLPDNSDAIRDRVLPMVLTRTFKGREDFTLKDRIPREVAGILTWALEGLEDLRARNGVFTIPESGLDLFADMESTGTPISDFVQSRCETGQEMWCSSHSLYRAWGEHCEESGLKHISPIGGFIKSLKTHLRARVGYAETVIRKDNEGKSFRAVSGVSLKVW